MPSHMLACPACRLFLHVRRNGVTVEETYSPTKGPAEPYKLWEADLWECEGCGFQVIAGFASLPLAEHYQPGYAQAREAHPPLVSINDIPGGPFIESRANMRRTCAKPANQVK